MRTYDFEGDIAEDIEPALNEAIDHLKDALGGIGNLTPEDHLRLATHLIGEAALLLRGE